MSHEGCEIVVSEWDIIHKCYFFDGFDISINGVEVVSVRGLRWSDKTTK